MKTPLELPRLCTVLATSVWDDGDEGRSVTWFKKFVKPYLIAAGIDIRIVHGRRPGDLGRTLYSTTLDKRIVRAAAAERSPTPVTLRDEAMWEQEKDGGLIIMGRQPLKEYLWSLRRGAAPVKDLESKMNFRDEDGEQEMIVRELTKEDEILGDPFDEEDGVKDRPLTSLYGHLPSPETMPTLTNTKSTKNNFLPNADKPLLTQDTHIIAHQPPLLMVPFIHPVGMKFWPYKIFRWFNRRFEAQEGAEAALFLIQNQTRPIIPPERTSAILDEKEITGVRTGHLTEKAVNTQLGAGLTGSPDLDFLYSPTELSHSRASFLGRPSQIQAIREEYYTKTLPLSLKIARELARRTREPTKQERKYPPKSEAEIRQERVDNECRWRKDLEGWAIVRRESGVAWEEIASNLRIFRPPSSEEKAAWAEQRKKWERIWQQRDDAIQSNSKVLNNTHLN